MKTAFLIALMAAVVVAMPIFGLAMICFTSGCADVSESENVALGLQYLVLAGIPPGIVLLAWIVVWRRRG